MHMYVLLYLIKNNQITATTVRETQQRAPINMQKLKYKKSKKAWQ